MRAFKVMVARFPGQQQEHPDSSGWVMDTLLKMQKDPRVREVVSFRVSDTPITMVRNRAAKEALAQGCDYLLMIDADMGPDCELGHDPFARPFWESSWEFLLARRDVGAVAAPYVGPAPAENVYVFQWGQMESQSPNPNFKLDQFPREEAARRAGVEEVAALATGLILYDTRCFEGMPHPLYYYEWKDKEQTDKASTEDVTQTRDMSMAWHMTRGQKGGRCWVNWDAWAAHIKLKRCRKPTVLPLEIVAGHFTEVMKNGISGADRVRYMGDKLFPGRENILSAANAKDGTDNCVWVPQRPDESREDDGEI